ncbi:hypothetical protein TSAR_005467, partial [Trichomalopsis sarcophagae]
REDQKTFDLRIFALSCTLADLLTIPGGLEKSNLAHTVKRHESRTSTFQTLALPALPSFFLPIIDSSARNAITPANAHTPESPASLQTDSSESDRHVDIQAS